MKLLQPLSLLAGLGASFLLGSCGGFSASDDTADGSSSSDLFVVSCSLGCSNGAAGNQVFCSVINTPQNQEISILFSKPIDLGSLNSASFRVTDVATGSSPQGTYSVDPLDPRRLVFRPALSFDQNGNPNFGLQPNRAYQVTVSGEAQNDPPPYITSTDGRPNQSRLQCTILTSEGIVDPVPGSPSVFITADVITGEDGFGNPILDRNVPVNAGTLVSNVWSGSRVRIRFNDIMNLASVVNPQTKTAPFIRVEVDQDGDPGTADRTPISGQFTAPIPSLDPGFAANPQFQAYVDVASLETYVVFQPDLPLPSAGQGAVQRRIAVTVPPAVVDLVGNPITLQNGGGLHTFVPEVIQFDELVIPQAGGEDFAAVAPSVNSREDALRSNAVWGNGKLMVGQGGGSGRLGELVVEAGETIVLNTDYQEFPLEERAIDMIGNAGDDPSGLGTFPSTLVVEDGAFEFSRIVVKPGGSLRIVGSKPARVYSRGIVEVQAGGIINLSGVTPLAQDSRLRNDNNQDGVFSAQESVLKTVFPDWAPATGYATGARVFHSPAPGMPVYRYFANVGSTGVEPGVASNWQNFWIEEAVANPINAAAGGDGGFGADRFGFAPSHPLVAAPDPSEPFNDAVANAGAIADGRQGQGVGRAAAGSLGAGNGGFQWPEEYPLNQFTVPFQSGNGTELKFNIVALPEYSNDTRCVCLVVGRTGSGGAYATDGTTGVSASEQPLAQYSADSSNLSNEPTDLSPGGDSATLGLESPNVDGVGYIRRKLEWFITGPNATGFPEYLRGGSGGGGGGNHTYRTTSSGQNGTLNQACIGNSSIHQAWHDHAGARGGFGGGALQLTSGKGILVNGKIDASGGDGGSSSTGIPGEYQQYAMPGGGGSGGAIKLQGPFVSLGASPGTGPSPGRLDVSGGLGGTTSFSASRGGDGGIGLIRIEEQSGVATWANYADRILPYDPSEPTSVAFLSVSQQGWQLPRRRPEGYTAAVSCWVRPEGNFFALNFRQDGALAPDSLGWDMQVLYKPIADPSNPVPISFRSAAPGGGPDGIWVDGGGNPISFEEYYSTDLGSAPVVVRFQGARAGALLDQNHQDSDGNLNNDPCNLSLQGAGSPIVPGSVSPWVDHPALLNDWAEVYGKPTPNMVRYTIVFDRTINNEDGSVNDVGLFTLQRLEGVTGLEIFCDPN
jgi:hypothetical protein